MEKIQKNKYIQTVRRSVLATHFLQQYFLKIIVVYLLAHDLTPWIAVSIPTVFEFASMLSRAIRKVIKLAVKIDNKRYIFSYLIAITTIFILISQSRSIFIIYPLTIILGFLTGINNSIITRINTSDKKLETYCFMEEERQSVIGATVGLVISQMLYDINPILYVIGFILFGIVGIIMISNISKIDITEDSMEQIDETEKLTKVEKKNIFITTILYAMLVGNWCIGLDAFYQLVPLISNKSAYLSAIYTLVEIIALFVINAKVLNKFKNKGKLLFGETLCAICDIMYLLAVGIFPNEITIAIVMMLSGISATVGDPLWGMIISSYSENNRKKYMLVNNIYFIVRSTYAFISIFVCKYFVIKGIESFKYLAIILGISIIIMYFIANKVNKKIYGKTI